MEKLKKIEELMNREMTPVHCANGTKEDRYYGLFAVCKDV
jgi:hypothetical protein